MSKPVSCEEVHEDIARVLDGTAPVDLHEHIADCDRCRDLRHDASAVVDWVGAAGADYVHPTNFEEKLMARLAAASAPAGTDRDVSSGTRPASKPDVEQASIETARTEAMPVATAPAKTEVSPEVPDSKGRLTDEEWAALRSGPGAAKEAAKGEAKPGETLVAEAPRATGVVRKLSGSRVPILAAAALALAAGVGTVAYLGRGGGEGGGLLAGRSAWSGKVASVAKSSDAPDAAMKCQSDGSACTPITVGDEIASGAVVRTARHGRLQLKLDDGSEVVLDHDSEMALRADRARSLRLTRGALQADVAHLTTAPNARMEFPGGGLEVIGTRFVVRASNDRSSVQVARGIVQLTDDQGRAERVLAGEEGRVVKGQKVAVAPSPVVAEGFAWSDRAVASKDQNGPDKESTEPLRGLGELKARRPGQQDERGDAVRLTKHAVTAKIVDGVARTEIDETFQNDTGDELEGIFRFPLPPDAQIERLALEVNGKLEEGAFVSKDRGQAIWRGVIQNAAPKAPKPLDEIVWVPGPWRDPALLEWKRGGRFELRIFPIPARGSRRVVLAYTQAVPAVGGVRRYTYPLPYDGRGQSPLERFDMNVQVRGHDQGQGVRTAGYTTTARQDGGADTLEMHESGFRPSGDLVIEYGLSNPQAELSTWAYQGPAAPAGDDGSPHVMMTLRPKLPRRAEHPASQEHVVLVDTSRSMVGERRQRARAVVSNLVRQLDEGDRVQVMACDVDCRPWSRGVQAAGDQAARDAEAFLNGQEADGATNLVSMVRAGRDALGGNRGGSVIIVSDGAVGAGPSKPDHLQAEVHRALGTSEARVTAVAIGGDADLPLLESLAQAGGGVVVPYVAGERSSEAGLAAAQAVGGVVLRDATIELPAGFSTVAPSRLGTVRAGSEVRVVGRMSSNQIEGEAVLRGKVGGEAFERRFPLKVAASSDPGNAFVPRMYAASRIADLERTGGDGATAAMTDLSTRYGVASRTTSLLVLESEAMMKAFGLERRSQTGAWTGDSAATGTVAEGPSDLGADGEGEGGGGLGQGFGRPAGKAASGPMKLGASGGGSRAGVSVDAMNPFSAESADKESRPGDFAPKPRAEAAAQAAAPAPTTAPMTPPAANEKKKADAPSQAARARRPPRRIEDSFDRDDMPRGGLVPMRKVWDRKGSFVSDNTAWHDRDVARITAAENALSARPDSRKATQDVFALFAQHGRLDRATTLVDRWASRDALDLDALWARSDVAARQADRTLAVRRLASLADVRPDDAAVQTRIADAFDRLGDAEHACAHRVTLAESRPTDVSAQAAAVRCARATGATDLADRLLSDQPNDRRAAVLKALEATPPDASALRGDVRLEGTWDSDADLDIALIDPQGHRLSWLGGGKAAVAAQDMTSLRGEKISWVNLAAGSYVVEVSRSRPGDTTPVRGTVTVRVVGETRSVPFVLTGTSTELGRLETSWSSRLVPAW